MGYDEMLEVSLDASAKGTVRNKIRKKRGRGRKKYKESLDDRTRKQTQEGNLDAA